MPLEQPKGKILPTDGYPIEGVKLARAEFFEKGEDDYEAASLAGSGRMQAENGRRQKTEITLTL